MLYLLLLDLDFVDVIKGLFPIVMIVIWVLSQVFGSKKEPQPVGRRREAEPEQMPEDRELRAEIEKFLKQAAGQEPTAEEAAEEFAWNDPRAREGQQKEREAEHREREAQLARQRERRLKREEQRQRQREQQRQAAQEEIVTAQVVEAPVMAEAVHSGSEALTPGQPHLHTSNLGQRSSQMDDKFAKAHALTEQRLHNAFDKDLVSIDDKEQALAAATRKQNKMVQATVTAAALFKNPASVREAIIISEILNRPADRW